MNDKIKELEQRVKTLESALRMTIFCLQMTVKDRTLFEMLDNVKKEIEKDKK